jgi:uncharacterized protein YndB with AHSA1/START domain
VSESSGSKAAENGVGREVSFTRTFDAPRKLVFKMWTDPKHLSQWWGPTGFTTPRCELDARPGGSIRVDMRGPDGTIYPMGGEFREIVEPERLVFVSAALDGAGEPMFENLNTVTFAEHSGKTTITLHTRVIKSTPGALQYLSGMELGWKLTLDKLEAYAKKTAQESAR